MATSLGRRFWFVWSATSFTNLGDGLTLVAFPLLAKTITDDARLIALATVFRFLPFALFGLPAGLIIDRFDRLTLAKTAQWSRGLTITALTVAVYRDQQSIALLSAAAFVVGTGEILTDGGLPAVVRDVVRPTQLEVANSRLSATQTVTNGFIGPPLGAMLFQYNHAAPFLASAVMFYATSLVLQLVPGNFKPTRSGVGTPSEPLGRQIMVGLRYVWDHEVLRPLALAVALFSFVGQAGNAVHVVVITDHFGFSPSWFGFLLGATGVTSVIASFFVAPLVARSGHSASLRLSVVTFSAAALMYGFGAGLPIAFGAALLHGISDPTWNVISGTIRQRLVPDEIFGRMMTAYLFVAWGALPIGAAMGGVVAQQFGAQWVFVISGLCVGSLLILGRPMFKTIDVSMDQSVTAAR